MACVLHITNSWPLNQTGNTTVRVAITPAGVNINLWVDDCGVTVAPAIGENSSVDDAGIVVLDILKVFYAF